MESTIPSQDIQHIASMQDFLLVKKELKSLVVFNLTSGSKGCERVNGSHVFRGGEKFKQRGAFGWPTNDAAARTFMSKLRDVMKMFVGMCSKSLSYPIINSKFCFSSNTFINIS